MSEVKGWTIAYRKRTANRFLRVTNWQGSWAQALAMAALFSAANPELQVWYVPTAEFELQGGDSADIGNVMVDSGKRIKIREGGELPAEMIARIPSPRVARQRWIDGVEIAEPAVVEFAGSHVYRGPGRCKFEDCGAGPTSPVHRDDRGLDLGIGHVAPATIERARAEALVEQQTRAWWKRHGLEACCRVVTAADILAARDADHAEALHEQIGRNEVARVEQTVAWRARHGLRQTSQHRHWASAIEADHDEALLEYAVRLVRP
jgi:hypothetical protein